MVDRVTTLLGDLLHDVQISLKRVSNKTRVDAC